ncbi:ferric reductase-like transmembrane domain-containing protein [Actinomyces naeslundii]|uniref:ferric reductase-like transmembrane domain-containing protein n=1 Tax=Actinomyces naeslundii TaxID=1655 RepID=UPI0011789903
MLCNVKNVPAITVLTFLVTSLATAIPVVGLLNALAMTAGAGAYGLMAATISISTRCPIIERLFGPRDKAYGTHKKLGMASAGLLIAHLGLTLATHDVSPLCAAIAVAPVIPLAVMGTVGLVLLLAAVAFALNAKLPYHLFQKVHGPAVGGAFTILSMYSVAAVAAGPGKDTHWYVCGPEGARRRRPDWS